MYLAYISEENISLKTHEKLNTVTLGYYENLAVFIHEDTIFLYTERPVEKAL